MTKLRCAPPLQAAERRICMIDFHSHVLHNIDDGSDSPEVSVRMLEQAYSSGTDVIVLTPHYYPREERTLAEFLGRRQRRVNALEEFCEGHEIPQLRIAAEVNLHTDFSRFSGLHELCISGTDYMLVEMPMAKWEDWMYECIYNITVQGIKPIIAHIDRYLGYPRSALAALDETNPLYQVNSEAFLSYGGRKKMLELFNSGRLHVIGSDMHGMEKRKNTLPEAYTELENRFGEEYISFVEKNGDLILDNKPVKRRASLPEVKKSRLLF